LGAPPLSLSGLVTCTAAAAAADSQPPTQKEKPSQCSAENPNSETRPSSSSFYICGRRQSVKFYLGIHRAVWGGDTANFFIFVVGSVSKRFFLIFWHVIGKQRQVHQFIRYFVFLKFQTTFCYCYFYYVCAFKLISSHLLLLQRLVSPNYILFFTRKFRKHGIWIVLKIGVGDVYLKKKKVVEQNKNPKSHTLRYVLGVSMMMKMIFLSLCYFSTLGEPTRFTCCEEAKITVSWNKNIYIYIYLQACWFTV
jgi:hypothetical protein